MAVDCGGKIVQSVSSLSIFFDAPNEVAVDR
jgi:hypothetical protein